MLRAANTIDNLFTTVQAVYNPSVTLATKSPDPPGAIQCRLAETLHPKTPTPFPSADYSPPSSKPQNPKPLNPTLNPTTP